MNTDLMTDWNCLTTSDRGTEPVPAHPRMSGARFLEASSGGCLLSIFLHLFYNDFQCTPVRRGYKKRQDL